MSDTQANPDTRLMHQTYWAAYELEADKEYFENLYVHSEVAQTIYISGYTYDNRHTSLSECADGSSGSYLKITHDDNCCWNNAWYGDFHHDPYFIEAGGQLRVQVRAKWVASDLRARDFSVVVWAEE